MTLASCTKKELYETIQPKYDEAECRRLPPEQYEECIKRDAKSYEQYQKERQEVIDK